MSVSNSSSHYCCMRILNVSISMKILSQLVSITTRGTFPSSCLPSMLNHILHLAPAYYQGNKTLLPFLSYIQCPLDCHHCRCRQMLDLLCTHFPSHHCIAYEPISHKLPIHTLHFNSHFPGEPGLAGCPLNSPSPFIPGLRILFGQA